jgi:hypothetical protein
MLPEQIAGARRGGMVAQFAGGCQHPLADFLAHMGGIAKDARGRGKGNRGVLGYILEGGAVATCDHWGVGVLENFHGIVNIFRNNSSKFHSKSQSPAEFFKIVPAFTNLKEIFSSD